MLLSLCSRMQILLILKSGRQNMTDRVLAFQATGGRNGKHENGHFLVHGRLTCDFTA